MTIGTQGFKSYSFIATTQINYWQGRGMNSINKVGIEKMTR